MGLKRGPKLALMGAAFVVLGWVHPAGAELRATIDENHKATAAVLEGLAGKISIRTHDGPGIRLKAEGSKSWIDGLGRGVNHGTLVLSAPETTMSTANSNMTIAMVPGARAETRIGTVATQAQGEKADELPDVILWMPVGTPLTITGAVGDWDIGSLTAPLNLEVSSAQISAGAISRGRLAIRGSGDITVERVDGDLTTSIAGSGSIAVLAGQVDHLTASVAGSGAININAPADHADLNLSGMGSIDVAKVNHQPTVQISGLGTVRTGVR